MKQILSNLTVVFLFLLSLCSCMQNLAKCPIETISLKSECESDRKQEEQNQLLLLGIAVASVSSSDSLNGKALEFYNIIESYRTNGSYTLTNGTTRTFLNSSKCSGSTSQHPSLNRAAQKHNDNMVRFNIFSHYWTNVFATIR